MNGVIIDDLQPLVRLSGLLDIRHQRYSLIGENAATLTDLRNGPAIFIGAFDNAWTLRLTRGLRFRFGNDPQMTHFWIEDTQIPRSIRDGVSIAMCSSQPTTIVTMRSLPVSGMRTPANGQWSRPASRAVGRLPLASFLHKPARWTRSRVRHPATGRPRTWNSSLAQRSSTAAHRRQRSKPRISGRTCGPFAHSRSLRNARNEGR